MGLSDVTGRKCRGAVTFFVTWLLLFSNYAVAESCQNLLSAEELSDTLERLDLFDEELGFSPEEYSRRIDRLRAKMSELNIDVAVISFIENLGYFTGFTTTNYDDANPTFLIVPAQGKVVAVTRLLENSNFIARSWISTKDLWPYKDTENPYQRLASVLKTYGYDKARVVGFDFHNNMNVTVAKEKNLRQVFKGKRRIDIGSAISGLRWEKSDEEIAAMRQAAKYTVAGMWAAIRAIKPGATLREVYVKAYAAMINAGSAPPEVRPYITAGPKTLIGHATLGNIKNRSANKDQVLKEGDVVFLELTGQHYGYIAPMMRTVYVGSEPPQELVTGTRLVTDKIKTIFQKATVGTELNALYQDFDKTSLERIGASNWTRHGYAAGGVNFPPGWNQKDTYSIKPGETMKLQANSTLHVIPWLQFQKDHGFYRHMERSFGDNMNGARSFEGVVTISDTLVATEKGGVSIFKGLKPPPLDLITAPKK